MLLTDPPHNPFSTALVRLGHSALSARCPVCPKPDMTCSWMVSPSAHSAIAAAVPVAGQRHPHRIEAKLISALGMGTNLDVAAADQSRPSATRAAKLIHPMRRIFIPHLGKMGLAHFSPSECEAAHTSRAPTGPRWSCEIVELHGVAPAALPQR